MKIHKILSGLMAVLMVVGLSAVETVAPAATAAAKVETSVSLFTKVGTGAKAFSGKLVSGAKAFPGQFVAGAKATPGYIWSGLKAVPGCAKSGLLAAKGFAVAHPYLVAGGCALTLAAIAAAVMYKKHVAKKALVKELEVAGIKFTPKKQEIERQVVCAFSDEQFALVFNSGVPGKPLVIQLEEATCGQYIQVLPNGSVKGGRVVTDMNGKHYISDFAYNILAKKPAIKHLMDTGKPLVVKSK